jgi:hypothetical protein
VPGERSILEGGKETMAKVGVEETEHKEGARGGQTGRFNAVNGFRKNWEWEEESGISHISFNITDNIRQIFNKSHNGQNNILRQEEYTEVPSKKPLQRNYPIVPSAIDSNLPV